jgi:Uma2 family endonuclease
VAVLVDPRRRTVTRFDSTGLTEIDSEKGMLVLLPGLELAVADVFSVLSS